MREKGWDGGPRRSGCGGGPAPLSEETAALTSGRDNDTQEEAINRHHDFETLQRTDKTQRLTSCSDGRKHWVGDSEHEFAADGF